MADYNVQMKQYNGTSFDNILPYASQALTLAGGGATEIIAQARAGLSQIATGSYVGNGVYTSPTQINVGFKSKLIILYMSTSFQKSGQYGFINGVQNDNWDIVPTVSLNSDNIKYDYYIGGLMLNIDNKPIIVYNSYYNSVQYVNTVWMTADDSTVSIHQNSYVSINNLGQTYKKDIRTASHQFNEQGVTYYYTAIG